MRRWSSTNLLQCLLVFLALWTVTMSEQCSWTTHPNTYADGGTSSNATDVPTCQSQCASKPVCVAVLFDPDDLEKCMEFPSEPQNVVTDGANYASKTLYRRSCVPDTTTAEAPTTTAQAPTTTAQAATTTAQAPTTTAQAPTTTAQAPTTTTQPPATTAEPSSAPGIAPGVDQTVLTGVAIFLFLIVAYFAVVTAVLINRKRSRVNSVEKDPEDTATSTSSHLKNGPPDRNGHSGISSYPLPAAAAAAATRGSALPLVPEMNGDLIRRKAS